MKLNIPVSFDLSQFEDAYNIILLILGVIAVLTALSCICRIFGWMEWVYKGLCCYCRRPRRKITEERTNLLRQEV